MYILHHHHRKRTRSLLVLAVLLVALGVGAYYSRGLLDTETVIGPAPAAVYSTVTDKRPPPKPVDEKVYVFSLPSDWEKFSLPDAKAGSQSWRNTQGNKGVRVITVYLDSPVQELAVNRVLPVEITADHLTITGDVSDNCVNFTSKQSDGKEKIAAKWQGADFICDAGNRFRNVVGIGSPGAPQGVVLTGPTTGKHTVYVTYTDSSSNFNSYDFTEMMKGFRLK